MKSKDVPQDDANMLQGKFKEPVYSLDENGNYTVVKSVGWDPKNEVMQEAWDVINEKVEATREKVLAGELSPIAFHLENNLMDVSLLAKYMGFWKWKVKRHLKPKHFKKLKEDVLEKYAEVFSISKDELMDITKITNK
ncbi:MAG: hypothetical protein C0595_07115 [Marinilabiliales bacterium]|nr:MAG: hypothetical protein C0595_07115 [Marinilabiliales bacterium]